MLTVLEMCGAVLWSVGWHYCVMLHIAKAVLVAAGGRDVKEFFDMLVAEVGAIAKDYGMWCVVGVIAFPGGIRLRNSYAGVELRGGGAKSRKIGGRKTLGRWGCIIRFNFITFDSFRMWWRMNWLIMQQNLNLIVEGIIFLSSCII